MNDLSKMIMVVVTSMLLSCTGDTSINEDKLYGTWKAWIWHGIYDMYITFNTDHTYKMMIGSHGEYNNFSGWKHPHYYYEGAWMSDEEDIILMSSDTIAHTLYNVDVKRNKFSFDFIGRHTASHSPYSGRKTEKSRIHPI